MRICIHSSIAVLLSAGEAPDHPRAILHQTRRPDCGTAERIVSFFVRQGTSNFSDKRIFHLIIMQKNHAFSQKFPLHGLIFLEHYNIM